MKDNFTDELISGNHKKWKLFKSETLFGSFFSEIFFIN